MPNPSASPADVITQPQNAPVTVEVQVPVVVGDTPPPPFATWCEWARNGYFNALGALNATGSGVKAYHIGARGLEYLSAGEVWAIVDQWRKFYEYYCGAEPLPGAITGRDTAFRVIPRDL